MSSCFRLTTAVRPWILGSGIERNFSFSPDAVRRLPWDGTECVTASSGYSLQDMLRDPVSNSVMEHTCADTAQSQSAPQPSDEGVSVSLGSGHKPESQPSVRAVA